MLIILMQYAVVICGIQRSPLTQNLNHTILMNRYILPNRDLILLHIFHKGNPVLPVMCGKYRQRAKTTCCRDPYLPT